MKEKSMKDKLLIVVITVLIIGIIVMGFLMVMNKKEQDKKSVKQQNERIEDFGDTRKMNIDLNSATIDSSEGAYTFTEKIGE